MKSIGNRTRTIQTINCLTAIKDTAFYRVKIFWDLGATVSNFCEDTGMTHKVLHAEILSLKDMTHMIWENYYFPASMEIVQVSHLATENRVVVSPKDLKTLTRRHIPQLQCPANKHQRSLNFAVHARLTQPPIHTVSSLWERERENSACTGIAVLDLQVAYIWGWRMQ